MGKLRGDASGATPSSTVRRIAWSLASTWQPGQHFPKLETHHCGRLRARVGEAGPNVGNIDCTQTVRNAVVSAGVVTSPWSVLEYLSARHMRRIDVVVTMNLLQLRQHSEYLTSLLSFHLAPHRRLYLFTSKHPTRRPQSKRRRRAARAWRPPALRG